MFYEKAKDPAFWEKVRTDQRYAFLIDQVKELYETYAREPITELSYDAFMDYHRTGNRSYFEDQYFARRQRLTACALLSLIYPDDASYFNNLMNTIWAICNEYCWALPCHNATSETIYNDDYLDLFSAETGQALSEIRYLLGDRMSPLMHARIQHELNHRVIESYLSHIYNWESWVLNWVAVCAGSIAMTFMLEQPALFEAVKPRIAQEMQQYIDGFQDDGVCLEGFAYWNYGFGYYSYYAQALYEFTKGEVNLFENEKVKQIAAFPSCVFLSGDCSISFSDGHRHAQLDMGLAALLEHHYGSILPKLSESGYLVTDHCGRLAKATRAFVYFDPDSFGALPAKASTHYMPDSGWFTYTNSDFGFAAKAGHNNEPHNHNDIGSFIFAANGHQILCDIGCGAYTRDYFNDATRYTILCNRSMGHGVPILDGLEQGTGEGFHGTLTYDGSTVYIDMLPAYPPCRVNKLMRRFSIAERSVTLTDSIGYEAVCPVVERFVTCIEPKQDGDRILLGEGTITYSKGWKYSVSSQEHPTHHGDHAPETIYLIDFTPDTEGAEKFSLTVSL